MSGASVFQTFRRITLQLAVPAIAALVHPDLHAGLRIFETPALVGLPGNIAFSPPTSTARSRRKARRTMEKPAPFRSP